jgi:hypothetical protein
VKLRFEFLTLFRQKIGQESLIVQLADRPGGSPTVREALQALEDSLGSRQLGLLEGGRVAENLLIFRKTPAGALERIRDPEDQSVEPGQSLVLSIAMDGG